MAKEKQDRYWHKTAPEGPWDAIVIGSGMGGMTAAALLSKIGKRVLVLEQHYVPGGFTHTFKRRGRKTGYVWDVGVHAVGEVTKHSLTGRMLADLSNEELEWTSLGPVYDEFHYPQGFRVDFPDSPEQFRLNLLEAFPGEAKAIDTYIGLVKQIAGGMKGYYLARTMPKWLDPITQRTIAKNAQQWLTKSTDEVHKELTDDPRLRAVFAAQWGYYGVPPSRSCFAMQALVVKHFLHGGYYPKGGSQQIARGLLGTVAKAGGWTRIRADVDEIVIEGGKAKGVRMTDGEVIEAKQVLSCAGVRATVERLLPPEVKKQPWAQSITSLKPGPAHLCLYLGFTGDITEAGASAANKWFYETWSPEDEHWDIEPGKIGRASCLYTSFPSLKDPDHDPGEDVRHTGEVVTFVPWDAFKKWAGTEWHERGEEYEAFKAEIQQAMLDQFFEHMPQLKPMLDYVELSTPLSTDHFCRPMAGSIYGLEPTPERFKNPNLRPRTPIKGLFFGGSEVTSVGVIGAMMGGVLAATAAAPKQVSKYMKTLA
jgi:all-trans-retinol 13,14-reductase